jgi:hypothetical protein
MEALLRILRLLDNIYECVCCYNRRCGNAVKGFWTLMSNVYENMFLLLFIFPSFLTGNLLVLLYRMLWNPCRWHRCHLDLKISEGWAAGSGRFTTRPRVFCIRWVGVHVSSVFVWAWWRVEKLLPCRKLILGMQSINSPFPGLTAVVKWI